MIQTGTGQMNAHYLPQTEDQVDSYLITTEAALKGKYSLSVHELKMCTHLSRTMSTEHGLLETVFVGPYATIGKSYDAGLNECYLISVTTTLHNVWT